MPIRRERGLASWKGELRRGIRNHFSLSSHIHQQHVSLAFVLNLREPGIGESDESAVWNRHLD